MWSDVQQDFGRSTGCHVILGVLGRLGHAYSRERYTFSTSKWEWSEVERQRCDMQAASMWSLARRGAR